MEPRIGDAERDVAAARLGDHFAAGRLDHEEYDERLDAVWSARTHADLDQVFWDMPVVSTPRPVVPLAPPARPRDTRFPVWMIAVGAIIFIAVVDAPWWAWLIVLILFLKRPWSKGHRGWHGSGQPGHRYR